MIFPVDAQGRVMFVRAVNAIAPFTYINGLKYDATGAVVIA